jgi:uncharacterized RDD family membrane protein YckC
MRNKQLAKRDEEGRQLSIFPESSEPGMKSEDDPLRKRHAEIRARVEEKLSKPRRPVSRFADAGDVTIPIGPLSTAAAAAPELDAPLAELDESEPILDSSEALLPSAEPGQSEIVSFELAAPGERILAGFIDIGIVSLMLVTLLYLTSQVGGHSLRLLPGSAVAALGVIGGLLTCGYFLFFWGLSGQTLGNLLTGSRVVGPKGGALGLKRAILRGIGVILSVLPLGAGFIGLWSDNERRCWHDRLAFTKVIRA